MSQVSLNGDWTLTSPAHPTICIPMVIPGDNYQALYYANIIPHPYQETNEQDVQWVSQCDWHLSRTFSLSQSNLNASSLLLNLSRLDTLADVFINDELVLRSSNMFQLHRIDITPFAVLGENRISIHLHRVDEEAKKRAESLPMPIPWAVGNNQIPHMNLIRKTQCHSGWDWGICLLVSGVYDPITIDVINSIALHSVHTEQIWHQGSVDIVVSIRHEPIADHELTITFAEQTQTLLSNSSGESSTIFHIEDPKLWWPAGYGEQPLYTLNVELDNQSISKKIGLRQLELNNKADHIGSAMEFVINGFPINSKGANWIPMDAMPGLESEDRYRELLSSAKDANMNMIRVWGGGQYESDMFYNICDELGLMIWQDMMFACSLYPSTETFINDVEPEIRQQIQRLKDHPSIVLWCGDNEVIGAIGWYDESKNNKTTYTVNYDRLNRNIAQWIAEEDPSRRFWTSSPCNGDMDFGDAWHNDNRGDMHFWDVWHSGKSFNAYLDIKPRFCSEFGFQSWPSFAEVKRFVPEQDWNVTSPTFESHQKNGRGNSIITEMFTRYFRFPSSFENMLYLSQVQQSIAIKTGCEYWRAISPICRGMLYWQLNDNWPVSSWSSIEYSGRWKQLHYHAKRFFAPTYVPFEETDTELRIRAVNDSRNENHLDGTVYWMDFNGEILGQWSINYTIEADGNDVIWSLCKQKFHVSATNSFFFTEIQVNGEYLQNTWFTTSQLKQLSMKKANISFTQEGSMITLNTDNPAFFVHLEHDGKGRFSDSSFTLLPEKPVTIEYLGGDIDTLKNTLRVYDLSNSY
ncbi:glycoside hydrolase family 2 protein [Aliivibrio sp. S4TY2]|uniref:beta-mannosidase n=1 Tax=unclassified Aliivibrio TaxID=2645654 RepID=UPI002379A273|nr:MULTISPECIES: glycoside hydrolase family 2 protein [unclassified Aliivibrio]MDD9155298.1 glycoside hydrolase family 2 protein [Aliivibrio sp. S4TY2]MDD9159150.1 glycoside hydrolase family 2 protein [Aliivibrio sp. S4TY1]MDD9163300.1 glycoside hydrolase family 2 protein [Aliivibrio sp. S4MY2]MDD9167149.1 glycoside hydrolase family 2 protein [Aliivibrio sp. S4MY4]MDD9184377.1 glycoside hydrolase family 2 protein [Aliivibrio sp. S4MY3]